MMLSELTLVHTEKVRVHAHSDNFAQDIQHSQKYTHKHVSQWIDGVQSRAAELGITVDAMIIPPAVDYFDVSDTYRVQACGVVKFETSADKALFELAYKA